jgi:hypothetical protein
MHFPEAPSSNEDEDEKAKETTCGFMAGPQLRTRTTPIDYLRIANPQARGPRKKSSSNSPSPASPVPGPSLSSDVGGSGLTPAVP